MDTPDPSVLGHYPVFYREIIDYIAPTVETGGTVVDCTVGSGGHSSFLLARFPEIKVIGFERDKRMAERALENLAGFGERFSLINDNFSKFAFYLSGMEETLSAIVYDYGISSYHLDGDDRGFAIKEDVALDMRLDDSCVLSAADVVNELPEKELADIFYQFGEERHSRRIARYICERRKSELFYKTSDLAEVVMRAKPRPKAGRSRIHPATKVFQALRIFVNSELESIRDSLKNSWQYLKPGGRICAISFHSLEDRIVKHMFRGLAKGCFCDDTKFCKCDQVSRIKILTKRVVVPSEQELEENSRSRSAKLRVCERV